MWAFESSYRLIIFKHHIRQKEDKEINFQRDNRYKNWFRRTHETLPIQSNEAMPDNEKHAHQTEPARTGAMKKKNVNKCNQGMSCVRNWRNVSTNWTQMNRMKLNYVYVVCVCVPQAIKSMINGLLLLYMHLQMFLGKKNMARVERARQFETNKTTSKEPILWMHLICSKLIYPLIVL